MQYFGDAQTPPHLESRTRELRSHPSLGRTEHSVHDVVARNPCPRQCRPETDGRPASQSPLPVALPNRPERLADTLSAHTGMPNGRRASRSRVTLASRSGTRWQHVDARRQRRSTVRCARLGTPRARAEVSNAVAGLSREWRCLAALRAILQYPCARSSSNKTASTSDKRISATATLALKTKKTGLSRGQSSTDEYFSRIDRIRSPGPSCRTTTADGPASCTRRALLPIPKCGHT